MSASVRNNVTVRGAGDRAMVFAHGYGCDQNVWRHVAVIAREFARVTFTSDNRADLAKVTTPTVILQCRDDVIAPEAVGRFVHRQIVGSSLVQLDATGHCPNLSAPDELVRAIRAHV